MFYTDQSSYTMPIYWPYYGWPTILCNPPTKEYTIPTCQSPENEVGSRPPEMGKDATLNNKEKNIDPFARTPYFPYVWPQAERFNPPHPLNENTFENLFNALRRVAEVLTNCYKEEADENKDALKHAIRRLHNFMIGIPITNYTIDLAHEQGRGLITAARAYLALYDTPDSYLILKEN